MTPEQPLKKPLEAGKMTTEMRQTFRRPPNFKVLASLAMTFGALTIFAGGSVLFGASAVRNMAGDIVPFVVWFNLAAGFLYVAAGVAIWHGHRAALALSVVVAASTAMVALAFGIWVIRGDAYEMRTGGALALRTAVWVAIALAVARLRRLA